MMDNASFEDERMKILRMVEEGKILASEGVALLSALTSERQPAAPKPPVVDTAPEVERAAPVERPPRQVSNGPRWFKVRITDLATGKSKTSITLPIGLVDWGLKIGARYAPDNDVDLEQVSEMLRMGVEGKLIDVIDEEDGEHVEIFVE
jgi:hypothetical protein